MSLEYIQLIGDYCKLTDKPVVRLMMPNAMVRQEQPPCQSLSVHLLHQLGAETLPPYQLNRPSVKLLHLNNSHPNKRQILAYRRLSQIKNNMKRQTRVFCVCVNSRVFSLPSPLREEGGGDTGEVMTGAAYTQTAATLLFAFITGRLSSPQNNTSQREKEREITLFRRENTLTPP